MWQNGGYGSNTQWLDELTTREHFWVPLFLDSQISNSMSALESGVRESS
jgi:hypothetical protein